MPTSNPIPSYDPTDLLFNAQKLDEVVNSYSPTFTDRFGVSRKTLKSIEVAAETAIEQIQTAEFIATNSATSAAASASSAQTAKNAAQAAAEASGSVMFYNTKALADAAISGLAANQVIEVFADESKGGFRTRYRKEGSVYVFKLAFKGGTLEFKDLDAFQSDTTVTYASGLVAAGDVVRLATENLSLEVLSANSASSEYISAGFLCVRRAVRKPRRSGASLQPAIVETLHLTRGNYSWPGVITGVWNVTGSKGSSTLTRTGGNSLADLTQTNGDKTFPVALLSSDEAQALTAICIGNDGSSLIYLRDPLERDFVGTMTSWCDMPIGQHLTETATKIWARNVINSSDFECRPGPHFGLSPSRWKQQPNPWLLNASLSSAPANDGGTWPDRVDKIIDPSAINMAASSELGSYIVLPYTQLAGRQSIGMWQAGHGVTFRVNCRGENAWLKGWVGCSHPVRNLNTYYGDVNGVQLRVRVTQDGLTVYEKVQNHILMPHRLKLFRAGDVKVEITLLTNTPVVLELGAWALREAGDGRPLIKNGDRVLCGLDSWGAYYGISENDSTGSQKSKRGLFARELEKYTGCTVIDMSEGGRTGTWVLAWLEYWIKTHNPDVFITDMAINDLTLNGPSTAFTFVDPQGITRYAGIGEGLVPVGSTLGYTQSNLVIADNLKKMHAICERYGVQMIYIAQGATSAAGQTQALAGLAPHLEYNGINVDNIPAVAADFSDAHSPLNEFGKYPGRCAYHTGLGKIYVSTGYDRLSSWYQQDTPATTITPTDTRAPVIISINAHNLKSGVDLTLALDADEDVTWTITGGADQAFFSLGTIVTPRRQMLNFGAKSSTAPQDADANNSYVVQVTATDGGGNATNQTVTITVVA